MKNLLWLSILVVTVTSCDYFKQEVSGNPVARVNQSYLYKADLNELFSETSQLEDSAQLVNNYINRWATQQLLIDRAKVNLTQEQLDEFEHLVNQYKIDLYTQAYKNNIVSRELDSLVSKPELLTFYELNKENFKLNDPLLKLRYVHVGNNFSKLNSLSEKLKRFNKEDKKELMEMNIQFKSYNLNDSTWIKRDKLLESLPILATQSQVLKKSNFAQLQDSLGVYLLQIEDFLDRNDTAPLQHVENTIIQIILNQRKQELIKKLEKDITKDAIKNKTFEIYPQQ
ncbi:peptidyl-prolyl cis-trans isomerase [Aureisphaera sp. CAU 1614]|uniref:Peptidyl-prolyl cis-trans isomerase n=1 Tax=Halomarinibacterium sedimenti TaxID=2857106 RepID=A0A9X1FNQ3_9FLAO|nr:peptidyl-prolyl cis-trans isomerase [Halomarinibacterium sedimenti]MBW2937583.1 peptidyl-prolyl cis-trans isomerase [Halomarinibacterium sedimenti]